MPATRHLKPATRPALAILGAALLSLGVSLAPASPAVAAGTVNVLYAGSLVNLMEHGIGPAFDKATGDTFQGFAGGSNLLANQIKGKLRHADVFVSANPKVNESLMGANNGDWVKLVHRLRPFRAGDRLRSQQQVRGGFQDQAVVPGVAGARD